MTNTGFLSSEILDRIQGLVILGTDWPVPKCLELQRELGLVSVVSARKFNLVQIVVLEQDLINMAFQHCPQLQNTLVSEETQVSGLLWPWGPQDLLSPYGEWLKDPPLLFLTNFTRRFSLGTF